MSKIERGKMMSIFLLLTMALAGFSFIPAGASAEGTANLKVVVRDNLLGTIDDAAVYCENVHTGARYDLDWDTGSSRYEANVPAGTYQLFASAEGFTPQAEPKMVYKLTSDNDDNVNQIRLNIIGTDAMERTHVTFNGNDVEGASVHLFGTGGVHLCKNTTPDGWANISAPEGVNLHMLIISDGMLTYSTVLSSHGTQDFIVPLHARPATPDNSYMVIGLVMNGSVNIPGLEVTVWDRINQHYVPMESNFEGAISLPLYPSIFDILIEADGYEPLVVRGVDLENNTYYTPADETFEMAKIITGETKVTTVNLAGNIKDPILSTVWTLDANSRLYGTLNTFGNPRMQIAGTPFSADWEQVDGSEVNDTRGEIKKFGPAWLDTSGFLKVNGKSYTADDKSYMVSISDLAGESSEYGVNPVITMTSPHTSDLEIGENDDIRVEVLSVMEGEVVQVILPSDYEILGDFGDRAEFIDGNTSRLRVFEPLEFNAKIKKSPDAVLRFVNYYDFYRVDAKKYIVKLDENVSLTAKDSSDPVGSIKTYMWNLPDGVRIWDDQNETFASKGDIDLSGMKDITFRFTSHFNGFRNITLQVEDSSKLRSGTDWILLMPDGQAPTIDSYTLTFKDDNGNVTMDGDRYVADEDRTIIFNASSAEDGKGEIVDWIWTFSDNTGSRNDEVVEHTFADPGIYNISLKVVDAVGNEIDLVNSTTIVINDITKPMAVIKPFPDVKQGDEVEMNATQSYDPRTTGNLNEDIVSWAWYVRSEGQNLTEQELIGSEQVFDHVFDEPGTFIVNLSVTDKSGLEGFVEKILLVSGPDLQVKGITFSDPDENNLREDDTPKISISFANEGTVEINGTWTIRITDNGGKVKEDQISSVIKAGETKYFNITNYRLKEGERKFDVYVDFDNSIPEMSEDNNHLDTTVTVTTKAGWFEWWYLVIVLFIILVAYVVYMKYTRGEWGYEPIQRWWENRNS